MPGGRMRRAIIHAVLFAVVVLFSATDGAAQQRPTMSTAAARPHNAKSWTARAGQIPQMPKRPGVIVPTVEAPGEAPSTFGAERPKVAEVEKVDDGEIHVENDEDAFLLPVVHRGFWAMPPGGMTRFLWQPPAPINPTTTLAADPVMGRVAP